MKNLKRILAMLFVVAIAMVSCLAVFASAAGRSFTAGPYDCDVPKTIMVTTGASAAEIYFKCVAKTSTTTITYSTLFGTKTKVVKHTCSVAPKMVLKVTDSKNNVKYYFIQGKGATITSTLKLSANGSYKINVSYYVNKCNECPMTDSSMNFHNYVAGGDHYADGSWSVTGTKNITSFSVK